MDSDREGAYAAPAARDPDVENGMRLVAMMFEKIAELDERVYELECHVGRRRRRPA